MLPIEIISHVSRVISLSVRLFGNIFGEDTLVVVFVSAAAFCLKASLLALGAPPLMGITALFMLLQTLTSIVQALIFALLTSVYFYMMLPHEEHAHAAAAPAHGH
jgi:F-type H+-transporting ATPase subunit a